MAGPDAATIRAWARAVGKPVGSRGAIAAELYNAYRRAQMIGRLRRVGSVAVAVAPEVLRAVSKRGPRPQQ
ncbi:hypothetical protein GCM10023328_10070 [Modestobacter marinus]|uniref:Lsr2 DNA-binding domain-containing protein n=1 Tax=Modestobacter marinus TaxID=477641 RepID=A0A846LW36_9ACTN|nr:hypothetical protein [Modestobacter marinus]GGL82578.1 hypothetical protein GCM10011589_43780 [Modestobacter marinus]